MSNCTWKDLFKIGVFSLALSIVSTIATYGIVATFEWIENGGISDLKKKIEEKKEAKKASKYVTKTLES